MTIEPKMLMAYADGELGPIEARRVERAIADDPKLAEEVARHRMLDAGLRGAYASIAKAPVPEGIGAMLEAGANVTDLPSPSRRISHTPRWIGAIAASLVLGLFVGQALPRMADENGIAIEAGQAVARGEVARALDTQLASTQGTDAQVRIGVTFRDADNDLCRTFERGSVAGIACSGGGEWRLARLYGGIERQTTTFRQASSASAAMMADAQAMMAGEPLNAGAEAEALADLNR